MPGTIQYLYAPFTDLLVMTLILLFRESLETLYNKESSSSIVILGGDFNLPAVLWNRVCGYVNTNPVYDLEVNKSLIDIANDFHLEQLVHENTPVRTTSWIFYFVLILQRFLRSLLYLGFQITRLFTSISI